MLQERKPEMVRGMEAGGMAQSLPELQKGSILQSSSQARHVLCQGPCRDACSMQESKNQAETLVHGMTLPLEEEE